MLNKRTFLQTIGAAGFISCVPSISYAHRQKKALSTIEWNANSSSLEITHILHRHDVEQALAALGKIKNPDLSSLKARATLALHIADQFKLSDLSDKPIDLDIIGAENEGQHIYAYFEAKMSEKPKGLMITNTILHKFYTDQINHVNVDLGTSIKSAVFTRGDKAKKVLA